MSPVQVAYDLIVVLGLTLSCLTCSVVFRDQRRSATSFRDTVDPVGIYSTRSGRKTMMVTMVLSAVTGMAGAVWIFSHAADQGAATVLVAVVSTGLLYSGLWFLDDRGLRGTVFRLAIAAGISIAWVLRPEWWLLDSVALLLAYGYLSAAPALNIRIIVVLFAAIIVWDIVGVLGTGIITGAAMAAIGRWPLLVVYPIPPFNGQVSAIGLGDILIPGLGVMLGIRYHTWRRSLVGYALGMVLLEGVGILFHLNALPATVTLCPGVLAGLLTSSEARRDLFPARAATVVDQPAI